MQATVRNNDIDLTLVCGARPDLIRKTLESFSAHVFRNFTVVNVFANIDRFQGGDREVEEVRAVILAHFPQAVIRTPASPSFTDAVKWLWGQVQSDIFMHLEDDWVANAKISGDMILPHFVDNTAQVSIGNSDKNWDKRHPFHCKNERRRILGLNFGKRLLKDEPIFTTSPSFLKRDFAHTCSSLMDPGLDPEKQLYNNTNVPLRNFTKTFRNLILDHGPAHLIRDIGRDYRSKTKLRKIFVNGQSEWVVDGDSSYPEAR